MAMKAICGVVAVLSALLSAGNATAQSNYPTKTMRILVGFAAAGRADMIARLVGDKLSGAFGQSVVIENVSGAAGNIAGDRRRGSRRANRLKQAPPRALRAV